MTLKEFASWVQGYFGLWPDGQKKDIADYLGEFSATYLDALKKELVAGHEARYGAPCVATLRRYHDATVNRMRMERPPALAIPDETGYVTTEQMQQFFDALKGAADRRVFK